MRKAVSSNKASTASGALFTTALAVVFVFAGAMYCYDRTLWSEIKAGERFGIRLLTSNSNLAHFEDTLTILTEMTAITGDTRWESDYQQTRGKLETLIEMLSKLEVEPDSLDMAAVSETLDAHKKLDTTNAEVFALVRQGDRQAALDLLADPRYSQLRETYAEARETFGTSMIRYVDSNLERHGSQIAMLMTAGYTVIFGMLFLLIVCRMVSRRNRERVLSDAAIEDSERRYRTLVENSDDTILTVDPNGVILFMNGAAARRLDKTPQQCVGKTVYELYSKQAADERMQLTEQVIASKRRLRTEVTGIIRGEPRWFDIILEPYIDAQGEVEGVQVIGRDIHESKIAAEKFDAYRRDMVRTEHLASMGTLAASVAHELKQPLSCIYLTIQNTQDRLSETTDTRKLRSDLDTMMADATRIHEAVDEFRSMTAKPVHHPVELVDLNATAAKIVKLFEHRASQQRVDIQIGSMSDLPDVYFNGRRLEQLLFSLIENAVQQTTGDRKHCVTISADATYEHIRIIVADDCGGISDEHRDRIFEPFFTTGSTTERTGLGLYITKHIVEEAGGDITLETTPGRGATFTITLPTAEPDTAQTSGPGTD